MKLSAILEDAFTLTGKSGFCVPLFAILIFSFKHAGIVQNRHVLYPDRTCVCKFWQTERFSVAVGSAKVAFTLSARHFQLVADLSEGIADQARNNETATHAVIRYRIN